MLDIFGCLGMFFIHSGLKKAEKTWNEKMRNVLIIALGFGLASTAVNAEVSMDELIEQLAAKGCKSGVAERQGL